MSDSTVNHPSTERLGAFLRGTLDDVPSAAIEDHLRTCASCCELLPTLNVDPDAFIGRLRGARLVENGQAGGDTGYSGSAGLSGEVGPRRAPPGFQIIEEVGRGGMGIVYMARQVRLNRLVALKMMLAGQHASPAELVRFHAEAEAVGRLQHPNIVQIHEIGEHEGLTYLALEFVAGGTLEARINSTPQSPIPAATLVATLARAIHAAHQRGIVHRDLKPGNILLGIEQFDPDGRSDGSAASSAQTFGVPKITDFGLAKWLGGDRGLTSVGAVAGTPSYMAPEQAAGQAVGPAADVYALGAVLYELLTGRPPFKGTSALETLSLVRSVEPIRPRQLQPKVPRDLETICLKCLQKEASKRYATAEELAKDLHRFLEGTPICARPVGWPERAVRWARRRPAEAGLLTGLMVVATVGASSVLWQWRSAVIHRNRAERSEAEARRAHERTAAALVDAEDSEYFNQIARAQLQWRLDHDVAGAEALLEACRPRPGGLDRRGWEWSYLKNLTRDIGRTLPDNGNEYIEAVAFSPDGRLVAAAGYSPFPRGAGLGFQVLLWDERTGRRLQKLACDRFPAYNLAFSPDGKTLVAGGEISLRAWDLGAWRAAGSPPDGPVPSRSASVDHGAVHDLGFSPDSRQVAVAAGKEFARIWDVASGKFVQELPHDGEVRAARFLPDGRHVATFAYRGEAMVASVWDLGNPPSHREVVCPVSEAPRVRFSRDGRLVATAGRRARIWEVATGRIVNILAWPSSEVLDLSFSPDGRSIATACSDRVVRVSDVATGEELRTFGHLGRVKSVDYHPIDGRLVSGGEQPGDVKLWDPAKAMESSSFPVPGEGRTPEAITFDPTGGRLLAVIPGGDVRVIDLTTGRHRVLHADLTRWWLSPATIATVSADGRILATVAGHDARVIQTWTVPDGTEAGVFSPLRTLGATSNTVYQLAMSRDGVRLASSEISPKGAGRYRRIVVWETASVCQLHRFPDQPTPDQRAPANDQRLYGGLALSPDGSLLAFDDYPSEAAGSDADPGSRPSIHLFELAAGRDRAILRRHDTVIVAAVFSGDGRILATADRGDKVILWDVATGAPLHQRPLEGQTYQLAFSPDGTRLAAINRQQLNLWDVRTGREALRLRGAPFRSGDSGFNPQLAWSPDGHRLAATNFDCTLSVWDAAFADSRGEDAAAGGGR
ncbi:MAG: protein kinase domain-containing protein [Isosphaeraceae bacterium]